MRIDIRKWSAFITWINKYLTQEGQPGVHKCKIFQQYSMDHRPSLVVCSNNSNKTTDYRNGYVTEDTWKDNIG